ncbi:hypothetical protein M409DRAFT_62397 [Zasmidium cellare ATCC 36951]|uniref:Major facilitator superfamily (MFS) profile domain-containing protein n=1 Tax=Zasmidium cellare ATCC 36951 TaxID=1080233 RepID=A0A6A6D2M7_ZASCE|nr:uncharacterized protein M409DRAFT_62397 [Zasmidium cellare ATCC 36951]KAF2172640.1 hypothetical protein M409DRAFT_62397 [Zasmidium cellare ATCC 36951]
MPFGILEPEASSQCPGTVVITDHSNLHDSTTTEGSVPVTSGLKKDASGVVVLAPQPSDSPGDPLNWTATKKNLFTVAYTWICGAVGALGPLLIAAYRPLSQQWGVEIGQFATGAQGSLLCGFGVGAVLFNAVAAKMGKRPVYLFTNAMLMIACFWGAASRSFASFVASRAVAGLCMGPMTALVPASVGDVWFVHERGLRTSLYALAFLSGNHLASPIAGTIIEHGSWRICMNAMGGAFGVSTLLVFFLMPETTFERIHEGMEAKSTSAHLETSEEHEIRQGQSYARQLLPYQGYRGRTAFSKALVGPFFALANPTVVWAAVLFMTNLGFVVGLGATQSLIFGAPPYNFSITQVGLVNLSAFVAALLGTAASKPLLDGIAQRLSKSNHGIFEPEFRLIPMVFTLLFTTAGYFVWGQSISQGLPWAVPVVVGLGFVTFGTQIGIATIFTYVVDCHQQDAAPALGLITLCQAMFSFGLTFYINEWVSQSGPRDCFFAIGSHGRLDFSHAPVVSPLRYEIICGGRCC